MQTTLITDIVAAANPVATRNPLDATVTLKFLDENGVQIGTAVVDTATLRDAAHNLLAMSEATTMHVAAPKSHAKPPRLHIPMIAQKMRPGVIARRLIEAMA